MMILRPSKEGGLSTGVMNAHQSETLRKYSKAFGPRDVLPVLPDLRLTEKTLAEMITDPKVATSGGSE